MSTNAERAQWAESAARVFSSECGPDFTYDTETCIGDLITDLLHLARKNQIDPIKLVTHAIAQWSAEESNPEPSANDYVTVTINQHPRNAEVQS